MEFEVSSCHNLALIERENEKVKYVWNDMHASFFVKVQEKEDQNKKPIPTQDAILSSLLWAQRLSLSLKIFWPIDSILFFEKSGKLDSWFLYSPVEGSETFWPASACKRLGSISSFFSKVRLQSQHCHVESESKCYFSWWRVKGNKRLLAGGG